MKRLCSGLVGVALLILLTSCSFVTTMIEEDKLSQAPSKERPALQTTLAPTVETAAAETTLVTIPAPPADDAQFVRVIEYIPDLVVELKYATTDNFTGQVIYRSGEAWLRCGTVKKLILVQQELAQHGLGLKLWDGFRPPSAQFKLWEICPDPTYVSDPNNGFSNHSRGNTVDITVVDSTGKELMMPTGFDDFTALADRDYSDCSDEAATNARMLENLMTKHGFKPYFGEWWHFTDTDQYDVEHNFVP